MVIRVLVCDELPMVRHGVRTLLEAMPDIEVVDTTDNGMEAMVQVRTGRPDVVVTDLSLQTISGLDFIRRLGKEDAAPNILVFTDLNDDKIIGEVLHAGPSCLLGKDASPEALVAAIRAAASGQTILAQHVAERLVTWFRGKKDVVEQELPPEVAYLTPREREVIQLVAQGMSTEDVAGELTIGVATVRTHLYRTKAKLGVRDRAQLVSLAYRAGLIHQGGRSLGGEPPE